MITALTVLTLFFGAGQRTAASDSTASALTIHDNRGGLRIHEISLPTTDAGRIRSFFFEEQLQLILVPDKYGQQLYLVDTAAGSIVGESTTMLAEADYEAYYTYEGECLLISGETLVLPDQQYKVAYENGSVNANRLEYYFGSLYLNPIMYSSDGRYSVETSWCNNERGMIQSFCYRHEKPGEKVLIGSKIHTYSWRKTENGIVEDLCRYKPIGFINDSSFLFAAYGRSTPYGRFGWECSNFEFRDSDPYPSEYDFEREIGYQPGDEVTVSGLADGIVYFTVDDGDGKLDVWCATPAGENFRLLTVLDGETELTFTEDGWICSRKNGNTTQVTLYTHEFLQLADFSVPCLEEEQPIVFLDGGNVTVVHAGGEFASQRLYTESEILSFYAADRSLVCTGYDGRERFRMQADELLLLDGFGAMVKTANDGIRFISMDGIASNAVNIAPPAAMMLLTQEDGSYYKRTTNGIHTEYTVEYGFAHPENAAEKQYRFSYCYDACCAKISHFVHMGGLTVVFNSRWNWITRDDTGKYHLWSVVPTGIRLLGTFDEMNFVTAEQISLACYTERFKEFYVFENNDLKKTGSQPGISLCVYRANTDNVINRHWLLHPDFKTQTEWDVLAWYNSGTALYACSISPSAEIKYVLSVKGDYYILPSDLRIHSAAAPGEDLLILIYEIGGVRRFGQLELVMDENENRLKEMNLHEFYQLGYNRGVMRVIPTTYGYCIFSPDLQPLSYRCFTSFMYEKGFYIGSRDERSFEFYKPDGSLSFRTEDFLNVLRRSASRASIPIREVGE